MQLEILKKEILTKNIDAIISTSEQTRIWISGLKTTSGFLIIEKDKNTLFIDGRYYEAALKKAQNVDVKLLDQNSLKDFLFENRDKFKKIAIEKDYLTVEEFDKITKLFPSDVLFITIHAKKFRIKKTSSEIIKVKKACDIALKAFDKLLPYIKPGTTEKFLDAQLEKLLRLEGAEKGSFDAIVVSGVRGSLPHGKPSDKILKQGELITIDFGAIYQGYCSDITRTLHVGNVTNPKLLEIESILKEAQKRGIEAVKPGITTNEIDKICRDYITSKGYGKYFVHSTGHGLGIDVHELPIVSSNKELEVQLETGMIITVEPGIYIPEIGGIRIEDDILVTKNGYEILSKLDRKNNYD